MTDFPQSVMTGSAVIKLVIDVIKPIISESSKVYLPIVAMVLGLARGIAFMGDNLESSIYRGVIMGGLSVGVNEVAKLPSEIKKTL